MEQDNQAKEERIRDDPFFEVSEYVVDKCILAENLATPSSVLHRCFLAAGFDCPERDFVLAIAEMGVCRLKVASLGQVVFEGISPQPL